MIDVGLLSAVAASAVTMAVPLLFTGLGELVCERAGIINVGQEGILLSTAFTAMVCAYLTGSTTVGVLVALLTGLALGGLLAFFVVRQNADQVVSGTALNLLAIGATGVAYRAVFGVTGTALTLEGMPLLPIPWAESLPVVGPSFFRQSLLGYVAFVLVPPMTWFLWRTIPGLMLRMSGENPKAATTQGVPVARVRMAALLACGVLTSLGGAFLSLAYARTFVEGMSAGRGFIALAIVIVGRWNPWGILGAALLFGLASAVQFHFQALGLAIPHQFFLMLPYVLTLLVLAVYSGRTRAPAALGAAIDS